MEEILLFVSGVEESWESSKVLGWEKGGPHSHGEEKLVMVEEFGRSLGPREYV